jgi:hypothetical protein
MTYEQATMIGGYLARRVESDLAWADYVAGRIERSAFLCVAEEKGAMFKELTTDERMLLDEFGELLTILKIGFHAIYITDRANLLGCVG